jgi:hypothetical protein
VGQEFGGFRGGVEGAFNEALRLDADSVEAPAVEGAQVRLYRDHNIVYMGATILLIWGSRYRLYRVHDIGGIELTLSPRPACQTKQGILSYFVDFFLK